MALEYEQTKSAIASSSGRSKHMKTYSVIPRAWGSFIQLNAEHIARVVWSDDDGGRRRAYPDTMLGMDSHTPMVNSLGIFGWGVGGLLARPCLARLSRC